MKQISNQFIRQVTLLAFLLTGVVHGVWGEETVYKTALFGSSYNSEAVNTYTKAWSATNNGFTVNLANFNNNNNNWNYIKCGREKYTSVATIITATAIDQPITKVVVTIDAITSSSVTSFKLYTSSDNSTWTSAGTFSKSKGARTVSLSNPTTDLFYKIEIKCSTGKNNGFVTISKVDYYYDDTEDTPITVTIGSALYTTYVAPANVTMPETLTAFIATGVEDTFVKLQEVEAIPAGTPIVIKASAADTYELTPTTDATTIEGNKLLASDGTITGDGSTIYALGKNVEGVVGFYRVKEGAKVPKGKAYLNTASLGVKEFLEFNFNLPTAIKDPKPCVSSNRAVYNLAGQRVNKTLKGIYIVGGKKVVVK